MTVAGLFLAALWLADPSLGSVGFSVEKGDGAEGSVEFLADGIRITKTSERGYLVVRSKTTVAGRPGQRLVAAAKQSSANADPFYSVGCLRLLGPDDRLVLKAYRNLNTFNGGGPRKDRLVNTPDGKFVRKFTLAAMRGKDDSAADFDGTPLPEKDVRPAIVVAGPPSVSVWRDWTVDDFEVASAAWKKGARAVADRCSRDMTQDAISADDLSQRLSDDIDHTARVVRRDGVSRLLVDGKDAFPALYRACGRKPTTFCAKPFCEAGVKLAVPNLYFGTGVKNMELACWTDEGFDVEKAVRLVRDALRVSPESIFIIGLTVDPPASFARQHPDEVWRNADGSMVYCSGCHIVRTPHPETRADCWPLVSPLSELWRAEVDKNVVALVDGLRRAGLLKRIVGLHVNGYDDGQFAPVLPDYSAPALRAWKRHLAEKFGASAPDWTMPTPADYVPDGKAPEFLDPVLDRRLHEFALFRHKSLFDVQDRIGRVFKNACGKDVVVIKWCMGGFRGREGSAYDFSHFVDCQGIDILVAQSNYGYRLPAGALLENRIQNSLHRHGKLYVDEFDFRSWARVPAADELSAWGLGWAPGREMWETLLRRRAGQMFALRSGFWFYDISGLMFNAPEIYRSVAEMMPLAERLAAKKPSLWRPSAAVVIDEEGLLYRNMLGRRKMPDEMILVDEQLYLLEGSGVPFELWLAKDIVAEPDLMKGLKTVMILGMRKIDAPRRQMLERLADLGCVVIHGHGNGCLEGQEATGFAVDWSKGPFDHEMVPAAGFATDAARSFLVSERLRQSVNGKKGEWASWGFWRPMRFAIADETDVRPIARYAEDGKLAIGEKGSRVYVCEAAGVSPSLFNQLVSKAGGFVATRPGGVQLNMNGDFVSVHGLVGGRYEIRLPRPCAVREVGGRGKRFNTGASVVIEIEAGETRWLELEQ